MCLQTLPPAAPFHGDCTLTAAKRDKQQVRTTGQCVHTRRTEEDCGRYMRAAVKARLLSFKEKQVHVPTAVLGYLRRMQRPINTQRFAYVDYSPLPSAWLELRCAEPVHVVGWSSCPPPFLPPEAQAHSSQVLMLIYYLAWLLANKGQKYKRRVPQWMTQTSAVTT